MSQDTDQDKLRPPRAWDGVMKRQGGCDGTGCVWIVGQDLPDACEGCDECEGKYA